MEIACMSLSKYIIVAGEIASGKSKITEIIRKKGYKVFDCDSIAKDLMKKEQKDI